MRGLASRKITAAPVQVRQRIQHEVGDEQERGEEDRESQGVQIRQRVRDPVADAMIKLRAA